MRTYQRALREFERWFARQKGVFKFRLEDIEAYKTYLMEERKLHQVSVSTYLTSVRRLCQFMVDIGDLPENPARTVKGNRRPREHSRKVLSQEEVDQLTASFDTITQIGKRDQAMMFAMLYAGIGEIEIVRADMQDLTQDMNSQDMNGGWVLWIQGKGRTEKDQNVTIDPIVMDKIRLYLDTRGRIRPEDPLFASHGYRFDGERLNTRTVRGRVNEALKTANLKDRGFTPHSLTHTAAMLWIKQGISIEELKLRMRHGTLETTLIYLRKAGIEPMLGGGKTVEIEE
jgi:site-specific recombinase XerD